MSPAQAQTIAPQATDEFVKATVTHIVEEGAAELGGTRTPFQTVQAQIRSGPRKGLSVTIEHGKSFPLEEWQKVRTGEDVVLGQTASDNSSLLSYYIADTDRTGALLLFSAIFFAFSIFIGRLKGFASILGLAFSILILTNFMIPKIAAGANPLAVTLTGACIISFASLYLAHGFHARTTLALMSTMATLSFAGVLAVLGVSLAQLRGLGAEETMYLQWGQFANLDFRGLLLGGIIIGTLGVLDDITIGQTAVVYELKKANPLLGMRELFRRAINVGREHIASLVNTLMLAYAGASLPALLLFATDSSTPLWITLNSEMIAEEIVRTLVGSTTLILAVPISTLFAARYFGTKKTR